MLEFNEGTGELEHLWSTDPARVFISHNHSCRVDAKDIKDQLHRFGIASFVAHDDIEPMKEWRVEIETALRTMDLFVALLSEDFSASKWTDQEVGVAFGLHVPIIPVHMGKDPYGFMDKHQAINFSVGSRQIASTIFGYLFHNGDLTTQATDAFVLSLARAHSFDEARQLAPYLPKIQALSPEQEIALVDAVNRNDQIWKCYEFNPAFQPSEPCSHENALSHHLKRLTGKEYSFKKGDDTWILDCLPF